MHQQLTPDYIRNEIADADIIYKRGERLFEYGACAGTYIDAENGCYEYVADGNYGDYAIEIRINGSEIEKFTDEAGVIIAGSADARHRIYQTDDALFKITNYEAVLRDVGPISRFKPDLVILDETQRIKNFNTKTADAVKRLPRKHAMVLTGTPLENKLEDVYSIIQFLDPDRLSPLWAFAADHFMLSRKKKGKILGYRNLDKLYSDLQSIVIRRKKHDVLDQLPHELVNNYFIDLTADQRQMHAGYAQYLLPLMNKKYLTPMDLRRIQELL